MQQRSSARSAGNSASLPVGITSWKINKTQVHEGRGSKARLTGGLEKPEAPRNNEIEPPLFSRREPSSLERLWNNAKSLSTLICQAIASLPSSPPLPRYTRNFEAGDRFSSFPLIRLSFSPHSTNHSILSPFPINIFRIVIERRKKVVVEAN